MERAFLTVTDLEEFIGNYAQNHLNQTVPKIDIRGEHAGKQILKADLEVFMIPISEFIITCIIRGRFQKKFAKRYYFFDVLGVNFVFSNPLSSNFRDI